MPEIKTTSFANSVFEQPWWLDTVAEEKWGEAIVKDGENVIARLPYVIEDGVIETPPYTQTLGIWMDPKIRAFARGNHQLHQQKEIIAQLLEQLPKAKSISMTLDHANSYILPFRWHGFRIEPTFSYRIKDLTDLNQVKSRISKSVCRDGRSAEKKLIVEEFSHDVDALIELQRMTFAAQNRQPPYPADFTRRVVERAIAANAGNLMIAKDASGALHSSVFFLYDENVCYYLIGGKNPEFKTDGANDLLLSKGISFAAEVSHAFDFEGSMVEGIEDFFRKFGGEQVINYHVTRQTLLHDVKDVLKPRIKKMLGYKL